ncbi:MAG TPA: retroviral-like aspartic protease family protein [Allosphingosinicella sp.]|nr:retroviral-like aspartic protease family protein [Allosphingosinicella sp.]
MRLSFLTGLIALGAAAPLAAQQPTAEQPAEPRIEITESIDLERDRTQRMTVPVSIDGRGPYRFIVDTGAERTVISRELANELALDPGRTATVYSMSEVSRIGTVVIPALEVGRRTVNQIHAPALARRDLGAEGLLGIDSLRSQRVELDFVRQEMTVTPSRREEQAWPDETIVITARSRYGHLMLVDASLDGERIYVIVDTGAQVTVANDALRRRLERRGRLGPLQPVQLISVTGGRIEAEYGIARRIRLGGAGINNLPVAFAEVHPFQQLRLTEQPAILLGMDALRLFERVSFDFANRRVRLLVGGSSMLEREVRTAARPDLAEPVRRPAAP